MCGAGLPLGAACLTHARRAELEEGSPLLHGQWLLSSWVSAPRSLATIY
jgi:hypothetical protein